MPALQLGTQSLLQVAPRLVSAQFAADTLYPAAGMSNSFSDGRIAWQPARADTQRPACAGSQTTCGSCTPQPSLASVPPVQAPRPLVTCVFQNKQLPARADSGVFSCAATRALCQSLTLWLVARSDSKLISCAGTPTGSRPLADPRIAQLQAAEAVSLDSRSSSQFGGQEFWSKLRGFEVEREVSSWGVCSSGMMGGAPSRNKQWC